MRITVLGFISLVYILFIYWAIKSWLGLFTEFGAPKDAYSAVLAYFIIPFAILGTIGIGIWVIVLLNKIII